MFADYYTSHKNLVWVFQLTLTKVALQNFIHKYIDPLTFMSTSMNTFSLPPNVV